MKWPGLSTACLILLNLALSGSVFLLWTHGQARVKEPERLIVPALELPDMSAMGSTPMPSVDIATIRNQAVFYASRAFYEPPAPAAEIPPPAYEFAGTMKLPNGKRVVFLKGKTDQRSRSIHVGEDLEGWLVQSVELDRLVLTRGEQTVELMGTKAAHSSGLIRGPTAPRVAQNGIRILSGTGSIAPVGATHATLQLRTYQPPPATGK